jgi:hypothetical protein
MLVSIPNLSEYHRALRLFDAGHGRVELVRNRVRVHRGRRTRGAGLVLARTGGDDAA